MRLVKNTSAMPASNSFISCPVKFDTVLTYLMEPGDALFFDAAARHGPEDLVEVPMQYLSIIIYPRDP